MPAATLEKRPEAKEKSQQKHVYRAPIAIYENSDAYTILVDLPGADEHSVQVRVEKGVLTIDAALKLDLPEGVMLRYSEISLGNYSRSLDFADEIDQDKIEAVFRNGMLRLTIPKSKSAQAVTVPIKTA